VAFLGLLYRTTGKIEYLEAARRYFGFAADCTGVFDSHFSHKVAWGAAILHNITREEKYAEFACRIADLLLAMQDGGGAWFHDQPHYVSYDQTAECASWLRQISAELCA
jgi:rhamnogalacturonyl hydrolase YesR